MVDLVVPACGRLHLFGAGGASGVLLLGPRQCPTVLATDRLPSGVTLQTLVDHAAEMGAALGPLLDPELEVGALVVSDDGEAANGWAIDREAEVAVRRAGRMMEAPLWAARDLDLLRRLRVRLPSTVPDPDTEARLLARAADLVVRLVSPTTDAPLAVVGGHPAATPLVEWARRRGQRALHAADPYDMPRDVPLAVALVELPPVVRGRAGLWIEACDTGTDWTAIRHVSHAAVLAGPAAVTARRLLANDTEVESWHVALARAVRTRLGLRHVAGDRS